MLLLGCYITWFNVYDWKSIRYNTFTSHQQLQYICIIVLGGEGAGYSSEDIANNIF